MADSDAELMNLGAEPHDEELRGLGAISPEDQQKVVNYIKTPQATQGEALREGFAEGGTFGFAPRIGAAMGAGMEKAAELVPGADKSENKKLSDLYNEYLEYNNKLQEKAKASHPAAYYAAMLAGGIASPLNKVSTLGLGGQAVEGASLPTKALQSGIGGAKLGALSGLSQSQNLADVPQDIDQAGKGAAFGGILGAGAPAAAGAIKGAANATASGLETVFGPVGARFQQGMQAGLEETPNLATQAGRNVAFESRKDFAKDFVDNLRNIIKSNAKNKFEKIQAASQDIPSDQVDNVLNEILGMDTTKMGTKEAAEFDQIKEEILRAKEGPMVGETVRQYNGATPPPVPLSQGAPTAQPAAMPQAPAQAMQPPAAPPIPTVQEPAPTPNEFQGYEAVHKATVDADDAEARELFKQKIHEKLADEEALGQNDNNSPIKIEEKPIPGTDRVRLIAKRAVTNEDEDAFKQQAQEHQRLQDLLDKQNEEAAKIKQQQETQMAQPQYQDIQQQVRAGGRNIYSPKELYSLQQLMQEYGAGAAPRMSTKGMQQVAKSASQDLSGILKENVGTGDVDQVLHAFNNIGEVLGIDPRDLQLPGGAGEKSREDALNQVFKIINPENLSDSDLVNQEKIGYIANQLKSISPELSNKFIDSVQEQTEKKVLLKEFSKPYEPSGINPEFNIARRLATKTSYGAGYGLGSQAQKITSEVGPAIQAGQKIFSKYSPESLQQASSKALASGDQTVQQFGQVLSKLATADERTRNSMIFVLQQQAGYKAMMDKLFNHEPEKTPQMKDMNLQKFK